MNAPAPSPSPSVSPETVSMRVGLVFRPSTPIDALDLFTGRSDQYHRLLDTIAEPGRHAIVYGERAVGKTSLVSILKPLIAAIQMPHFVCRVTCATKETFGSLWQTALNGTVLEQSETIPIMFHQTEKTTRQSAAQLGALPANPSVNDVKACLERVPSSVYIFDEFDRLHRDERRLFTDLLKTLSDHAVNSTVIMVGIADTVDDLITDHRSITRAVTQVRVPRMRRSEIREVLEKAEKFLGIQFDEPSKDRIETMAQGLPHYAHLLGKHSVRMATAADRLIVTLADVVEAEKTAISEVDHETLSLYLKATQSARKDAKFEYVLLACALARKDELGFFRPAAIVSLLSMLRNEQTDFGSFMRHLEGFIKRKRGPVLQRSGPQRAFKYRFLEPLLPPLVILKGLSHGLLTEAQLAELAEDPGASDALFGTSRHPPSQA